ncbi:MAG: phosphoglycerate mutase [Alphaproteobacteria bacterium HGW-Alphaproteobacteria-5]|nr:MAG: phosphoglycerate mutase [Alphaproteobacteria bacterium HGW-Alphaproteobacteria-5]
MRHRVATELILIRHAPALAGGRLCGRSDVAADCGDGRRIAALGAALGRPARVVTSPALRCRQTAAALWPGLATTEDAALWEQDFGEWEGRALADLPDLGTLPAAALADHRPPGGESFADLCARVQPALVRLADGAGPVAIVAHAGTVRAGLALALGASAPALAFAVAPLSATRISALPAGDRSGDQPVGWSIGAVNWTPA